MRSRPHRTALKASFNVARRIYWQQRLGVPLHHAGDGKLDDAVLDQLDRCADDDARRLLLKFSARAKREKREPKPKAQKPIKRTAKIGKMMELARRAA